MVIMGHIFSAAALHTIMVANELLSGKVEKTKLIYIFPAAFSWKKF